MKFAKGILKFICCVVASLFVALIGNESVLETGKFNEQMIEVFYGTTRNRPPLLYYGDKYVR